MSGLRRLTCALFACALTLAAVLVGPAKPSLGDETTSASDAYSTLAQCISRTKHVLVVLLVDESGSLQQTDPQADRVAAARVALSGLESLHEASGSAVDVQLAGFAVGYVPVGGWRSLDSRTLPAVLRDVDSFAQQDNGIDTDYYAALRGAQASLAQQAAAARADTCKAILWFTDGKYDIQERDAHTAQTDGLTKDYAPDIRLDRPGADVALADRGRSLLCSTANPLIDQIRRDGVSIFAVMLATEVAPADFAVMSAVTSGHSGSTACGSLGSALTGATVSAANVGDLLSAFDRAANEAAGGSTAPGADQLAVCAGTPCPEGRRTFELDDTLRRFHLLARIDVPGIQVQLSGPGGGPPLILSPGSSGQATVGPVPVTYTWVTTTALTVDGTSPPGRAGWDGSWSVTFVDPSGTHRDAVARSQIFLFSDLVPHLDRPPRLEAGKPAVLPVSVLSSVDNTTRTDVPAPILDASVTDPSTGQTTPLDSGTFGPDGRFEVRYSVPSGITASEVFLTLRLTVHTRKGVALVPAVTSQPLPVYIAGLPTLQLVNRHLDPITRTGSTRAVVQIQADPRSDACVWLAGADVQAPASAGRVSVSPSPSAQSQSSCLKVAKGQTASLLVRLDPRGSANGLMRGRIKIAAVSATMHDPVVRPLDFDASMARPINSARRLGIFLALLLPGILLPLIVAYLANIWAARFQPIGAVASASIPVQAKHGVVYRVNDEGSAGDPLRLTSSDFEVPVEPSARRQRGLSHGGLDFSALVPLNPFSAAYATVRWPGHFVGGSRLHMAKDARSCRIGLALPGEWVVGLDQKVDPGAEGSSEPVTFLLVVFAEVGASAADLQTVTDDVASKLPGTAERLIGAARANRAVVREADDRQGGSTSTLDSEDPDLSRLTSTSRVPAGDEEPPPW